MIRLVSWWWYGHDMIQRQKDYFVGYIKIFTHEKTVSENEKWLDRNIPLTLLVCIMNVIQVFCLRNRTHSSRSNSIIRVCLSDFYVFATALTEQRDTAHDYGCCSAYISFCCGTLVYSYMHLHNDFLFTHWQNRTLTKFDQIFFWLLLFCTTHEYKKLNWRKNYAYSSNT